MDSKTKMNMLAAMAKDGCAISRDEIYRIFIPVIENMSRRIWHMIDDHIAFEQYCYKKLDESIRLFDPAKDTFSWMIAFRFRRCYTHFVKNRSAKRRQTVSLDEMTQPKQDRKKTIDFEDVLANVESEIVAKDLAALLAKGDSRKMAILNAWIEGCTNDSDTAQLLAQLFGGKAESHRQAIKRFRTYCRAVLAATA